MKVTYRPPSSPEEQALLNAFEHEMIVLRILEHQYDMYPLMQQIERMDDRRVEEALILARDNARVRVAVLAITINRDLAPGIDS